jgi:hypothetical protein
VKWCGFHKIPWHNTDECRSKQSLVVKVKDKEPKLDSESDPKNIENIQIINADSTATVATTTIQPEEPIDPEEGERLFDSHMWVKGTPFHFIVDSGSQKNLISAEFVKQLGCQQHHTCSHTTLGGFTRDIISMSASDTAYPMAFNPSRMR